MIPGGGGDPAAFVGPGMAAKYTKRPSPPNAAPWASRPGTVSLIPAPPSIGYIHSSDSLTRKPFRRVATIADPSGVHAGATYHIRSPRVTARGFRPSASAIQ